jgi:hypothetical protein
MRETAKDSLLKYEQRRAKRENMKAPQWHFIHFIDFSLSYLTTFILLFFSLFPRKKKIYIPHKVDYCYSTLSTLWRLHDYSINIFNFILLPTLLFNTQSVSMCEKKVFTLYSTSMFNKI